MITLFIVFFLRLTVVRGTQVAVYFEQRVASVATVVGVKLPGRRV